MMKTVIRFPALALVMALTLAAAGDALAQGTGHMLEIERELERTEQMIRRTADLARDAGNARAVELIQRAMELQMRARNRFRNNEMEMARANTMTARTLVQRATAMLLNPEERADRVEHELRRTDEMLSRARDHVGPAAPETVLSLLEFAQRQQEQSWELLRGGSLKPALRMTHQVREVLRKLAALAGAANPERLQAEYQRTAELVETALVAARETANDRAMQMAEQAEEMMRRGHILMEEGKPHAARRHMEQARKLAKHALSLTGPGGGQGTFEAATERYERMYERLAARLQESRNDAALDVLAESREHYRLARELATAGGESLQRANAELRLAFRLLERVRNLLG